MSKKVVKKQSLTKTQLVQKAVSHGIADLNASVNDTMKDLHQTIGACIHALREIDSRLKIVELATTASLKEEDTKNEDVKSEEVQYVAVSE